MHYAKGSIKKFLEDLSERTPAPGGGAVSALALASAAGLVAMACRFTLGKDKYRDFEKRCRLILKKSLEIERRALALLDADIEAYKNRDSRRSIEVPAQVCRLSLEVLAMADETVQKGNVFLRSDAELAARLASVSISSAFSYVKVNVSKNKVKYGKLLIELKKIADAGRKLSRKYRG